MKRIEPKQQYDVDGGYPSVVDVDLSRRGFLGAALAGSAGLGVAFLLPGTAEAGRKRSLDKVALRFRRTVRCKHAARHRVDNVVAASYDRRLTAFLRNKKQRASIVAALIGATRKLKCADLTDAKRLAGLQKVLGRALQRCYKRRTGRTAARPAVTVVVGRLRRHPQVDGGIGMPTAPVLPDHRNV